MKFVIFKGISGEWYFRIVARNGRILAHSEGYSRKQSAKKAVRVVYDNCLDGLARTVELD